MNSGKYQFIVSSLLLVMRESLAQGPTEDVSRNKRL